MSKINLPENANIKRFEWLNEQDIANVVNVLKSGELSGFLATDGAEHLGGEKVQELERAWEKFSGIEHAITFNSWTSGLEAAVAALELPQNSEVIVTPWTMSATVAAIVNNDLVPVFADISQETFNISVEAVSALINDKTSAIMAVDIFGKPCEFLELSEIARKHKLELIVDSAQAPTAKRDGKRSADFASISGYSFNRHKHIQSGEGGIAVTASETYAKKMRLYRNHSEVSSTDQKNFIQGHNMRFGEIEATLILGQLARINHLVSHRVEAAKRIIKGLDGVKGIRLPKIEKNENHDFYIVGVVLEGELVQQREAFLEILTDAKLPGILKGYVNVHNLYQFVNYKRESLQVAEELHEKTFIGIYMCGVEWTESLTNYVVDTFTYAASKLNGK